MKKFVFLYNSEPNATPSDSDMDVWMTWFESIKESVTEMGNPFMGGMLVTSDSASVIPPEKNPISGYTVIKAVDIEAAIAIAKSCPSQTGLQLYEAIEM
ncbi:MAG: hypothetical protein Q8K48_06810 [Candidatus Planktophila sp.]|nr:hypothetical protein [Candidatus Planktophila sp.]